MTSSGRPIAYGPDLVVQAQFSEGDPGLLSDRLETNEALIMAECRVIHPDGLETEVRSGSMTRLTGVSEGLVGSTGIHLAIATIPPGCASSPTTMSTASRQFMWSKGAGGLSLAPIWKMSYPSARETLSMSRLTPFTSQ